MANEEHLRILKQGVEVWNQWREDDPGVRPNLQGVELIGAHLSRTNLTDTDFRGANLSRANLIQVNLMEALLTGANLTGANLSKANLIQADLLGANLLGANLFEARLIATRLIAANLMQANLTWANLTWANLRETVLDRADMTQAIVGWTTFADIDLSTVEGLGTVYHAGPSTIGIDTIYRSRGKIPEIFLRGTGVPEDFITYAASLVGKPIQFYSCFISYSSQDQEIAERLHADLQSKGIRTWFAPEDMKIGDEIRPRIDQTIRLYDRLLLILSQHSIDSDWVEAEVETALEEERRRKRTVLFPIRLDDGVMETEQAWAAHILRTRHIGDFRRWKDHDAYREAFDRLLRDLEVEDAEAGG